jgi:hypothetical protein
MFVSLIASCLLAVSLKATPSVDLESFRDPSSRYGVGIWWHWPNGNISEAGITKDLEAMRDQAIVRATLFDIGMGGMGPLGPVTPVMGNQWLSMVKYAAAEANRTGVKLALQACPGWSELGGPWISPENSMKRLVWSQTFQKGGRVIELDLPELPSVQHWAKEVTVLAWPVAHVDSSMQGATCVSNGKTIPDNSLWDGNPNTMTDPDPNELEWELKFDFPSPHATDHLRLQTLWVHAPPPNKIQVRMVVDGQSVMEKEIDGHALADVLTLPFAHVTGRDFSLEFKIAGKVEPWLTFRNMQISEAELLDGEEPPQWNPGLLNSPQQMGSTGDAGNPLWSVGKDAPPLLNPSSILDLRKFVNNGHLRWQAPEGTWRIVRFGFTTTGVTNRPAREGGQGLETDKMNAQATALHFNSYIKRVLDAAGNNRTAFDLLSEDSWEVGRQNWTDDFSEQFQARRGYAIEPYLAVATGEVVGSQQETKRFLNDFRKTISDLIAERFYATLRDLAHSVGLQFAAELNPGGPAMDMFALARAVDQPMDEFWSDNSDGSIQEIPLDMRTKLIPDAAFLAGKPITPIESFTSWSANFSRTPGDYGYLGDVAFFHGYNQLVLHSFVHQPGDQPPGITLSRHGQDFNRLNTWWPMFGDWLLSNQRSQYLLQSSEPVYNVMVYYGDAMPTAEDAMGLPSGVSRVRIDHPALMNRVSFEKGHLMLDRKGNYSAIIFPSGQLLPETVEKIATLTSQGATLGVTLPFENPSWTDHVAQDQRLGKAIHDLLGDEAKPVLPRSIGAGKIYNSGDIGGLFDAKKGWALDCSGIAQEGEKPLLSYHKISGDTDIFLVLNPNNTRTTFSCNVLDDSGCAPEMWDMATGRAALLPKVSHEGGRAIFPLTLEGKYSTYILFPKTPSPRIEPASLLGDPIKFNIEGNWKVSFKGLPQFPVEEMDHLRSWTENANPLISNYSGVALYEIKFLLSPDYITGAKKIILDLGDVSRVARVTLNGKKVGTLWRVPWNLDVSGIVKNGENTLMIEVVNTWLNRMLADEILPPKDRLTKTTWDTQWWAEKHVVKEKSGLLGPVTLLAYPENKK